MKRKILPLFSVLVSIFLSIGCSDKKKIPEADLPVVESFVVEKIANEGRFSHSVEYVFIYPEGLESYTSFPPLLWNDGGRPEGESFLLSRLDPKGKAEEEVYRDGRRLHARAKYDLSGLLSSEHTNYIRIQAGGRNGKIKSVSIPIEK